MNGRSDKKHLSAGLNTKSSTPAALPTGYSQSVHWAGSATCQLVWVSGQGLTDPAEKPKLPHNLQDWRTRKQKQTILNLTISSSEGFEILELKDKSFSFSIPIKWFERKLRDRIQTSKGHILQCNFIISLIEDTVFLKNLMQYNTTGVNVNAFLQSSLNNLYWRKGHTQTS